MRSKTIISSIALAMTVLIAGAGYCAFSSDDKGTSSASFLKLGVGGRAEGLGEAFSAVTDDAVSLYWNPAGLASQPEHGGSAVLMHAPYVDSGYYDYLAASHNTGALGAWGVGVQYFTPGSIVETDRGGAEYGEFRPYDMAASLGYANSIGGFSLGVAAKYIQSKIISSAQTFAADLGLMTPTIANDRLRFGLVAQNLGGKMKFDETDEDLPLTFRVGSALSLTDRWLLSIDGVMPNDNQPYANAGTEYRWPIGEQSSLAGRVGFNSRSFGDIDGLSGLAVGLGMNLPRVSVDYAFLPMGQLGLTHRVSLGLRWGALESDAQRTVRVRSPRSASHEPTCEELYGADNCRGSNRWFQPAPMPSYDDTAPSDRPW
jgi:hypothetical protein